MFEFAKLPDNSINHISDFFRAWSVQFSGFSQTRTSSLFIFIYLAFGSTGLGKTENPFRLRQ